MSLLILFLPIVQSDLLYGFSWMNFTFNTTEDFSSYYDSSLYSFAIPTGIQVNKKGELFISLPRFSENLPATLTKLEVKDNLPLLSPFPDWWSNNLSNPVAFQSIITFQIDLNDNFWLLDNKAKELIRLDSSGSIITKFNLTNATTSATNLVDLVIDLDRNFAYISDSGSPGILVLNMNDRTVRLLFVQHYSVMPDKSLWITINKSRVYEKEEYLIGVSGLALSCDKRDLYYSAVTSRELFAINTMYLRNASSTDYLNHVANLGYKNTASQGLCISEKGNMYMTDISNSNIYYYEQMMPYPDYFLYYFLTDIIDATNFLWPYSLGFNNTKRTLLVLANQFQNFNTTLINYKKPINGDYNFWIYELQVDDRSYLFGCQDVISIQSAIDTPVWIYALISIMSLILITVLICAVKHYRMIKRRHGTLIFN